MLIEFDHEKSCINLLERGLSFERVQAFEFETAVYSVDARRDYGETRVRAFGLLEGRLHALVFFETTQGIRVISFRRANPREVKRYEQTIRD